MSKEPKEPSQEEPAASAKAIDDEPIPKLPRAPLLGKPSTAAMVRIGMFGTLFYAIIVMRKPCAEGAGRFLMNFDDAPDAGSPPAVDERYPGFELISAEEALKRWPDSPSHDAGVNIDGAAPSDNAATGETAAAGMPTADARAGDASSGETP